VNLPQPWKIKHHHLPCAKENIFKNLSQRLKT